MLLRKSFISCMQGALIGDCLGAKFEFEYMDSRKEYASQQIDILEKSRNQLPFTDDTEMTRSIASSFISKRVIDPHDMAARFSHEYFAESIYNRGYGNHISAVFAAHINISPDIDIFEAASNQFSGSGSYGNGSAMRCAPVALYTFQYDISLVMEISKCVSMITHTHNNAIEGAMIQCIAIRMALNHRKGHLDANSFITELLLCIRNSSPYYQKMKMITTLLKENNNEQEVIEKLGNGVEALFSVPIAIFCFLKALNPIEGINRSNAYERSVVYAISMGGDTDTIASMTGAIAGAYHTLDGISPVWFKVCEGIDDAQNQAIDLFEMHETFTERHDKEQLQRVHDLCKK